LDFGFHSYATFKEHQDDNRGPKQDQQISSLIFLNGGVCQYFLPKEINEQKQTEKSVEEQRDMNGSTSGDKCCDGVEHVLTLHTAESVGFLGTPIYDRILTKLNPQALR